MINQVIKNFKTNRVFSKILIKQANKISNITEYSLLKCNEVKSISESFPQQFSGQAYASSGFPKSWV